MIKAYSTNLYALEIECTMSVLLFDRKSSTTIKLNSYLALSLSEMKTLVKH